MIEQVKFYDLNHWEHSRYDGFYWQGETVYNADNYQKPIIKRGKAPCLLLDLYPFWFTMDKVKQDLIALGFEKKDNIIWEK